jgi:hypothetical protein
MDEQELRKLLEQLHDEIERTDTVDEKGRELLTHVSTDIRELLARSGGGQPALSRMQEAVDHLEVTHPTLTMLMSQILAILNNAGI